MNHEPQNTYMSKGSQSQDGNNTCTAATAEKTWRDTKGQVLCQVDAAERHG